MTTPRVTVPVEDLAGKLKSIRDKFLMPTPDKDFTDYAIMTRCVEALSAAPAPEGGAWIEADKRPDTRGDLWLAVDGDGRLFPGVFVNHRIPENASMVQRIILPKDAALATREEAPAPCKSCNGSGMDAGSRFNRCPDCCEEAPAEAGALEWSRFKQMCEEKLSDAIKADHGDAPFPMDASEAASYHRTRADLLGWVLDMWPTEPLALRAQPSAREDAQPVAWVIHYAGDSNKAPLAQVTMSEEFAGMMKHQGREVIALGPITHPAPDALRVAAEALETINHIRSEMVGVPVDSEAANAWALALDAAADHARQTLAALQADQKGGA